jgi:hypothetical protein
MNLELRKIARGCNQRVTTYTGYDVNGYRFHTHDYTMQRPNKKTINSGVLCEGTDKLHYYGRVERIYEMDYGFASGQNPVVFKCHWFDPRRVRRIPDIGWVEVERSSVYAGDDVYILATQAFQVFYLPYPCKNPKKRLQAWDVVITVPPHSRPPLPSKEDYRRLDPSTYDGEFYQEEGLPGKFTINLHVDEDMGVDEAELVDEVIEEDDAQIVVEEVQNQHDLILLDRFHNGLDVNDEAGPPEGYQDEWWNAGTADSDDETLGPPVIPNELNPEY